MFRVPFIFLVLVSSLFNGACSTGGSSSGGGGSSLSRSSGYSPKDMEGNWSYRMSDPSRMSCNGVMTFSGAGQLSGFTNSCCPGGQKVDAEFWIFSDGYVKGRNYAWCNSGKTNENPMLKYSMNFRNMEKNEISGIVDLHYTDPDYIRMDITLTRQNPLPPPPPDPDPNNAPQSKKSVKAVTQPGPPLKK
jgi:hypothetical protein